MKKFSAIIFLLTLIISSCSKEGNNIGTESDSNYSSEVFLSDSFVSGSRTIIQDNGLCLIETPNNASQTIIVVIDSIDVKTGNSYLNNTISICFDKDYIPLCICYEDKKYATTSYDNNEISYFEYSDNEVIRTYKNIPINKSNSANYNTKSGSINGLDALSNGLSIAQIIIGGPKYFVGQMTLLLGSNAIGGAAGDFVNFAGGVFSTYVANSKLGLAGLAVSGAQIIRDAAKLATKLYFGDCTPEINVEKLSFNSATVTYIVRLLLEPCEVRFRVCQVHNESKTIISDDLWNGGSGSFTQTVKNLQGGKHTFYATGYPDIFYEYPWLSLLYGLDSETASIYINPLEIDDLKQVSGNTECSEKETVHITIKATLQYATELDKTVFQSLTSGYGICVKIDGKKFYYQCSEFPDGIYLIELDIPASDFEEIVPGSRKFVYTANKISFCSFWTEQQAYSYGDDRICDIYYQDHPHAIDLGLSVKWACCNLGADCPEGKGGYFAWGETKEKDNYTFDNYQHGYYTYEYIDSDGDGYAELTAVENFKSIGRNISGGQYDAARSELGNNWRMPTLSQLQELKNNCNWIESTLNGKDGYRVTSKINGESIFIPFNGFSGEPSCKVVCLWASTSSEDDAADGLEAEAGYIDCGGGNRKKYGLGIRPVM